MSSKLAMNIRYFRLQNNWTHSQLAKKLSISRSTISKWENEAAEPDIDTLVKLSDLFSVSVDQLVGRNLSNEFILKEFERVYSLDIEKDNDNQHIGQIIDWIIKSDSLLEDLKSISQLSIRKQRSIFHIMQSTLKGIKRL